MRETPNRTFWTRRRKRGGSLLETTLVLLPFAAILFATVDLNYAVFCRALLRHAVRQGARYASTGQAFPGMGHDASIKEIVKRHSLRLLASSSSQQLIGIAYYTSAGSPTYSNSAGNTVVVSVNNYRIAQVAPVLRPSGYINATVAAVDVISAQPPAR